MPQTQRLKFRCPKNHGKPDKVVWCGNPRVPVMRWKAEYLITDVTLCLKQDERQTQRSSLSSNTSRHAP